MRRRKLGILLLFTLLLLGFAVSQFYRGQTYYQQLEASYRRAFREFAFHLDGIEKELGKVTVASSTYQQNKIWADLSRLVYVTQSNLGELPINSLSLSRVENFIAKVQSRAVYHRKMAWQDPDYLPPRQEVSQLYEQAQYLNGELQTALANFEQQDNWMNWKTFFQSSIVRSSNVQPGPRNPLMQSLVMIEDGMNRFPDSDFPSELARLRFPELDGETISEDKALAIGQEFLGELAKGRELRVIEQNAGELPTYTLRAERTNDEAEITVEISQERGLVLWMLNPRIVEDSRLQQDQLITRASDFLEQRGFTNMVFNSAQEIDNRTLLIFVTKEKGVLIYPEQIKVQLANDNGQILSYQALAYYTWQKERELTPSLDEDEARAKVTSGEILASNLVVTFDELFQEILSYEFRVKQNQEQFLVYINGNTGIEEKIIRVEPGEVFGW